MPIKPAPETTTKLPSISIVVPAFNEADFIERTLTQLARQDYPRELVQILVVDGGSSDATLDIVKRFSEKTPCNLFTASNKKQLASAGRNIGIDMATNDYILFVDAHSWLPNDGILHAMAQSVMRDNAQVLGRPQPLNPPNLNVVQSAIAAVRASSLGHSRESFIFSKKARWVSPLSVGVMYHHSLFEVHGNFDESFDAAEDVEFNYRLERANIQAYISPQFTIRYFPRKTLAGLFRQMERYGIGRERFFQKHPERRRAEVLLPCFTSLGFIALLASFLVSNGLRPYVACLFTAGAAAVMLITRPHFAQRHVAAILLAPFCLITIHLGLALGILKQKIRNTGLRTHFSLNPRQNR